MLQLAICPQVGYGGRRCNLINIQGRRADFITNKELKERLAIC